MHMTSSVDAVEHMYSMVKQEKQFCAANAEPEFGVLPNIAGDAGVCKRVYLKEVCLTL